MEYPSSQENSFEPVRLEAKKLIQQIEGKIHDLLIETTADLIKSYQNQLNEKINLREILLVLVVFAQQDLPKLKKNHLVVLKQSTYPLVYREKTVTEEVELLFTEFKRAHRKADEKSERKLASYKHLTLSQKSFFDEIPEVKIKPPNKLNIENDIIIDSL